MSVLFYECITKLSRYLKRDLILKYIYPMLIDGLTTCSLETKIIIVKHLSWIIKYISFSTLRQQIHEAIIKKFCYSNNYQDRIMYIEFCSHMVELMSKAYFKEHFLIPLNTLWEGKTNEELYKLCVNAPKFRKALLLNDGEQAAHIINNLKELSNKAGKRMKYVADAAFESLKTMNSPAYVVSDAQEKELLAAEYLIKKAEKKEIEEAKKQEIELLIKQARMDVMSKISHPGPKSKTSSKMTHPSFKGLSGELPKSSEKKVDKTKKSKL